MCVKERNKEKEHKISQINCDLQELKQIRNLIDNMINEEVELDISNMKLAFEPGVFRALLEGNHIE